MNPIWAFFFKDKFKTPFSLYKMSLAELVFLLALSFGVGYGLSKGVQWILLFNGIISVEEVHH